MSRVAVLGAGSWGTALAEALAFKGEPVVLWGRNPEKMRVIAETQTNPGFLPDVVLNKGIEATSDIDRIKDAEYCVVAIPTQKQREFLEAHKDLLKDKVLINVAKGIEVGSHLRLSQVYQEVFGPEIMDRFVILYGPSHAEEVARHMPTTLVVAAHDMNHRTAVQEIFSSVILRVYTNDDLLGVELGGALKNIIALAIGMTLGLGYGDNARAALMTRGLAEITRLGVALGADPLTFLGLTGVGDLIVTCTSKHSRNRTAGVALGEGKSLDEVLSSMGMVVEGVSTTKATYELAQLKDISMPIVEGLYGVLFHDKKVEDMAEALMTRDMKSEKELY